MYVARRLCHRRIAKFPQFFLTSFFLTDVMIGGKNRAFATRRDAAKL